MSLFIINTLGPLVLQPHLTQMLPQIPYSSFPGQITSALTTIARNISVLYTIPPSIQAALNPLLTASQTKLYCIVAQFTEIANYYIFVCVPQDYQDGLVYSPGLHNCAM